MFLALHLAVLLLVVLLFGVSWAFQATKGKAACTSPSSVERRQSGKKSGSWDFFGIRRAIAIIRAVRNGTLVSHVESFWDAHGDTYAADLPGTKVIFTRDAANMKQFLKIRFMDYTTVKTRIPALQPLVPGTIGATEGPYWKHNRTMWRRLLINPDDMIDMDFAESSFQKLTHRIPRGVSIDVLPLFLDMSTDIVNDMALGESPECSDPHKQSSESREYVKTFEQIGQGLANIGMLGPLTNYLPLREYRAQCRAVKNHLGHIIEKYMSAIRRTEEGERSRNIQKDTFLSRLVAYPDNLEADTMNYNITAFLFVESLVSVTLSHAVWLLARNPTVYEKLRKSVLEDFGYEKPTLERMGNSTYIRNILNETLRLMPPEPILPGEAKRDTVLPTGGGPDGKSALVVRKGQTVVLSLYGSHRNPATFGRDAADFRPERWDGIINDPPGYAPFSTGPRSCMGQQPARKLMTYLLVRLVQRYSRVESRDSRAFTPKFGISLSSRHGVWVALTPDPLAAPGPEKP